MPLRPVWAEIDLGAIAHNLRQIKKLLAPVTKLCVVVKANAYGHGAVAVANTADEAGADFLAVAVLGEALELRNAGITTPILVLGPIPSAHARLAVREDLSQTVYSYETARRCSQAARELDKKARLHIKVDTGMSRLGIAPSALADFLQFVAKLPGLEIEGIYSHLAAADADNDFTVKQIQTFTGAVELSRPFFAARPPLLHLCNSAGTLAYPGAHFDMVRAGLAVYGLWPASGLAGTIPLRPALKLKAAVSQVRQLPAGAPVGYGCGYKMPRDGSIATIPIGYADGWDRGLSNRGQVTIAGRAAPIAGRVCMDQSMVDVTGLPPVSAGDEALLLGGEDCPVESIAAILGTINYEIVSRISPRVPRIYK